MASLSFDKVGKTFGDGTVAVSDVSIDLQDGESVVLVGPSGCGKTTLLRLAAGLERPTDGRLLIDGVDVTETEPEDRDVAMVFQNYALYPHMTVYQNMAFGLEQRRTPRAEIERLVSEAAQTLDLTRYLQRKPAMLSGGQRQRVAMGRAMVRHPAVFLLDEPLSNLDAKLRVQMRTELRLLSRRLGATTLYVTHDQVEAMTMGDRVAVLKPVESQAEGNLQQIDTPQALYDRPANMFVAGFIGSPAMNFLRVRLMSQSDHEPVVDVTGAGVQFGIPPEVLLARPGLRKRIGQDLVLGIRPESFAVVASEAAVFHAEVLVTEAHGADSFVFFDLAAPPVSAEERLVTSKDGPGAGARLAARVPSRLAVKSGEKLPLSPDPLQLHWFDLQTTMAIGPG